MIFLLILFGASYVLRTNTTILRPRGVSISMAQHYDSSKPDFFCLDVSARIPYEYVNDDYCDCPDGSDEPGTAACYNGKFHCTNAGHIPQNIASSRVNDGICDCCDGTDEYEGIIQCSNNCKELGRQARIDAEMTKQLLFDGYQVKQEYMTKGKQQKQEKEGRLHELTVDRIEAERKRIELEDKKNECEGPETDAKERVKNAWEDEKKQKQEEKEKKRMKDAFEELDTNNDGMIDVLEMLIHPEFDIDANGDVSEDEAKEYLEDRDMADATQFAEKVWPNINEIFKFLVPEDDNVSEATIVSYGEETQAKIEREPDLDLPDENNLYDIPEGQEHDEDDHDEDDDREDYYDDDEDDDDEAEDKEDDHFGKDFSDKNPKMDVDQKHDDNDSDTMPAYDEETQKLIDMANAARKDYDDADNRLKSIDSEIEEINKYLAFDLGPDYEFAPLKGECFEYTEREYTYKLCPFERATQRSKNGGSETTLGNWGHWDGPENDKYAAMKYEKGQNCWNGPDRSVKVILHCGKENKLHSATEPSRCEYQFDFTTPALCRPDSTPDKPVVDAARDEL